MASTLVTGGTGSLGRAVTERLLQGDTPVVVYSRHEYEQYRMRQDMPEDRLSFVLGDVRDADRLVATCREFGVRQIIHTAALKYAPSLELNPTEAIRTNIEGTLNVIRAADRYDIDVIGVSTDKACAPICAYGASKLVAERLLSTQAKDYPADVASRRACVRLGNIVGSRGSVIAYWRELAERGQPLPLTDSRMTRHWMTLDAAVSFVLWALRHMRGGEVFVPKIPRFRVEDLARSISDNVKCIGRRPGEKLHESLLAPDELAETYDMGEAYALIRSAGPLPLPGIPDDACFSSEVGPHMSIPQLRHAVAA